MTKLTPGVCLLVVSLLLTPVLSAQIMDNGPDMTINSETKRQAIKALAESLKEKYVFPDIGDKVAKMLEQRQAHGDYNSVTSAKEFAQLLTKQMDEIAHDGHMRAWYSAKDVSLHGTMRQEYKENNYFFEDVKRLDGNVGYFKFNHVVAPDAAGPIVAGAMAFLANTDALILDLRDNSGGNPSMVQLIASYFFSGDNPILLNTMEFRKPGTREYTVPDQSWTLPYVSGQRYLDREVYVLISHQTFSGGEELTYDLQTQKRATIVGEATGGGANPPEDVHLADHFYALLPVGRAVNPITHTNWEGVGVKPDIEVSPQNALHVAYKTALEHLITKTNDIQEQEVLKRALAKVEEPSGKQKH